MGDSRVNPMVQLSRVAMIAAAVDLGSKYLASRMWSVEALNLGSLITLQVIPNHAGAFGWSAGAYTWQLNLALTLAAVVFIIPVTRDLAAIDKGAPVALGLIVGGAVGNLASMVLPPAGVVDFIGVHLSRNRSLVLNLADVAAYGGLALICRTGYRIASTLRERAAEKRKPKSVRTTVLRPRTRRTRIADSLITDWNLVRDTAALNADAPPRTEAPVISPEAPRRSTLKEFSRRVQIDRPPRDLDVTP